MDDINLVDIIINAQNGDPQSWENLIDIFSPLLKKYTSKLNYEDAYYDLRYELIKAIIKLPVSQNEFENNYPIFTYIQRTIKNAWIKYSKRQCKEKIVFYNELNDEQLYMIENQSGQPDNYFYSELTSLKSVLTELEFDILYRIYILDQPTIKVAADSKISRQAVNQAKLRAIDKIKKIKNLL